MARGLPRVGATRVRVGTLSECISEVRIEFHVIYAHGLPFAFLMRKFAGFEYHEIATALDCSPQSARASVYQALKKLKMLR